MDSFVARTSVFEEESFKTACGTYCCLGLGCRQIVQVIIAQHIILVGFGKHHAVDFARPLSQPACVTGSGCVDADEVDLV